jgi:hypothetical protein
MSQDGCRLAGGRYWAQDLRSTPTQVALTAWVDGFDPVVSVFGFEERRT